MIHSRDTCLRSRLLTGRYIPRYLQKCYKSLSTGPKIRTTVEAGCILRRRVFATALPGFAPICSFSVAATNYTKKTSAMRTHDSIIYQPS
jgi:hypothetical protein